MAIPTVEGLKAARNSLPLQALFYVCDAAEHLDLGSNDGRTLRGLDLDTVTAIELFEPSVQKMRDMGVGYVCCEDVRDAAREFADNGVHFDRVTMMDVIEHLPREDGERIIEHIEQIATREILFFVPWETPEMWKDKRFLDYREWGLSQHPDGQRTLHDHLALWSPEDFKERGYITATLEDFHGPGWHAFFAAKYKQPGDRDKVVARLSAQASPDTPPPPKPALAPRAKAGPEARIANPLMLVGREYMDIHPSVIIGHGARLECVTSYGGAAYEPTLSIGEGTTAEAFLHIGCAGRVSIGADCIIAGHVTIMDHDHGLDPTKPLHYQPLTVAPVVIGDSVFVGEGAYVGKGVRVGDHAVIGAGAVVTRDVPAYATVAGVPARVIRQAEAPEESYVVAVIPTWNGLDLLKECIASIDAETDEFVDFVVVDNGSDDGTAEWLDEWVTDWPALTVVSLPENVGFPRACNKGIEYALAGSWPDAPGGPVGCAPDYILLLNNDTEVTPGWLTEMLRVMRQHPECGIVGPMSDNVSGRQRGEPGTGSTEVSRLVGFCLLIRREVIERIGGLDPVFGLGNYDDDDYCLRAQAAGWTCRIAHGSFVRHLGHQTWKRAGIDLSEQLERNRQVFLGKWSVGGDGRLVLPEFDPAKHYVPLDAECEVTIA